jgi:hypothetical protein
MMSATVSFIKISELQVHIRLRRKLKPKTSILYMGAKDTLFMKNSSRTGCRTCGKETGSVGHMCAPKTNKPVYECQGCGILSTDQDLLCKPKHIKLR